MSKPTLTTGEVAEKLGVGANHVRYVYQSGKVPEPPRVGTTRAIPADQVPAVAEALKEMGRLPSKPVG